MIDDLQINEKSGVPVWVQIRNHIAFLVKSGQLRSGDVLPTVRELAVKLGVNYNTVHKVYQDLETDKLICSSRGKRSTVNDIDAESLELPASPVDVVIKELVRVAKESGLTKEETILRVEQEYKVD